MGEQTETIFNDANKLEGYKVTYSYIALPTYSESEIENWYKKVTKKFNEAPGVIKTITYDSHKEKLINSSKSLWELPNEYKNLQDDYEKKLKTFLREYGEEYEELRNSFVKSLSGISYSKYFLTPLIEISEGEIILYYFNVKIYENGTIEIEMFEDINDMNFDKSLLYNIAYKETSLYANRFKSKTCHYISKKNHGTSNILKSIEENLKIEKGIKFSKTQNFYVYFLKNAEEINESNEIYREFGIEYYIVNAPHFDLSLIKKDNRYVNVPSYDDHHFMKFMNKAAISVVTPRSGIIEFRALLAYFSSTASYHFQQVFLTEIKLEGVEKLEVYNEKDILNFKQWLLKYRRLLTGIYRPSYLSMIDFYHFLQKNTYFRTPDDLDEITNEEMNIIQMKSDAVKEKTNQKMRNILFIIGLLSIVQAVGVFFENKILILLVSILLTINIVLIEKKGVEEIRKIKFRFVAFNIIAVITIITIVIIYRCIIIYR